MNKKAFLEELENNKGKNLIIEVNNGIIQKTTIQKLVYDIKEDNLLIRSDINSDFVMINLNTIRKIAKNSENITVLLEDKQETIIKMKYKSYY